MSDISMVKVLQFSAIIFGIVGLCLGCAFFRYAVVGFAFLGVTFGTLVGAGAACYCLVINRRYCAGAVSLVVNLVLFIIVAREMQIIG